jgi:S-formylglutathione hydrolase FrmB
MAYCELHYFSQALGKQMAANVLLPQSDAPGPYPVLYLLHGLSDDYTAWMRNTSIARYVSNLPLIVVMPDGGRGFYCDAIAGFAYETGIITDLVNYIDKMFPTKAERGGRALAGLSMGGYGAMKLALSHPDMFCSTVSHSGALDFAHVYPDPNHHEFGRIIGENPMGGPNDLYGLADRFANGELGPWPHVRIDCGTEDFLLDMNRNFTAHLKQLGLAHEYEEFPGAHEWGYWDEHIKETLAFHAKHLGLETESSRQ